MKNENIGKISAIFRGKVIFFDMKEKVLSYPDSYVFLFKKIVILNSIKLY